jgi:preprotein translocase subunit SecE
MKRLREIFAAYADELLNKVHWPRYEELQSNTITVLVASLIIATAIALMDFAFSKGLGLVYGLFE